MICSSKGLSESVAELIWKNWILELTGTHFNAMKEGKWNYMVDGMLEKPLKFIEIIKTTYMLLERYSYLE